jgi:hypothetical protein
MAKNKRTPNARTKEIKGTCEMYILRSKISKERTTGIAAQAYWAQRMFWERLHHGYFEGTKRSSSMKKANKNQRVKIKK